MNKKRARGRVKARHEREKKKKKKKKRKKFLLRSGNKDNISLLNLLPSSPFFLFSTYLSIFLLVVLPSTQVLTTPAPPSLFLSCSPFPLAPLPHLLLSCNLLRLLDPCSTYFPKMNPSFFPLLTFLASSFCCSSSYSLNLTTPSARPSR